MTDNPHTTDVTFIRALAELLRENDLTELRVKREYGEDDSLDVRVSRGHPAPMVMPQTPPPPSIPSSSQNPVQSTASQDTAASDPASHAGAVSSPMVGTVYMAPEPGAADFVSVGDTVQEGQTLLIIEAMKTMNQIPAPRAGTVKRILVEDGAPIEFGAPLMIVE